MRNHLNASNDIETLEQMRDVILSAGGVPSVNVALCETIQVSKVLSSKTEGVSQLNNVEYKEEGLLVWRAYGIGDDKPTLTGVTLSHSSSFTDVKERRIKASVRDPDPSLNMETKKVTRRSSLVLRRVVSKHL